MKKLLLIFIAIYLSQNSFAQTSIDIDSLIRIKAPLFTQPLQKYLEGDDFGGSYKSIAIVDTMNSEKFTEELNRYERISLYPFKKLNDSIIVCTANPDSNEPGTLYVINLKESIQLNEICLYPTELNFSNFLFNQFVSNWKIQDYSELKCLLNSTINKNEKYNWKSEFYIQDLINKKIEEIRDFKFEKHSSNIEFKLEAKSKLENYNFQQKGFNVNLGSILYYSDSFLNLPLGINISVPYFKATFDVNLDNLELIQKKIPHSQNGYLKGSKLFYQISDIKARELVDKLNSEREILITFDLKMVPPNNSEKLNLCEGIQTKIPFIVSNMKIEPFSKEVSEANKTFNDYNLKVVKYTNADDTFEILLNQLYKLKTDNEIFTAVEQQPEFPGGPRAFGSFIQKNLKYPLAAERANVGGKVYVQFIVNTDGTIEDVKVLKSVGFGCDEEAIRIIKSVPRWAPGKQSGRPVRSRFTQPITFVLDNN